jgi:putative endonuclease
VKAPDISGAQYESQAVRYLEKNGYRVLEKNFRTRLGEIDIVAMDGEDIVFCEVKGGKEIPPPFARVTATKIKKILYTAQYYIHIHPDLSYRRVRIDVLSITLPDRALRHFKDITAH